MQRRQQTVNCYLSRTGRNSLKTSTKQHRSPCYVKSAVRMFALEVRGYMTEELGITGRLSSELSCLRSAKFGCYLAHTVHSAIPNSWDPLRHPKGNLHPLPAPSNNFAEIMNTHCCSSCPCVCVLIMHRMPQFNIHRGVYLIQRRHHPHTKLQKSFILINNRPCWSDHLLVTKCTI